MLQVAAHQRLVVADGRQAGELREIGLAIGRKPADRFLADVLGIHVAGTARQGDVGQEPRLVVHAPLAIQQQPMVQHVQLERIVCRRQPLDEAPQAGPGTPAAPPRRSGMSTSSLGRSRDKYTLTNSV